MNGLELYFNSDKAVAAAKSFQAAVDQMTRAVEEAGKRVDGFQGALDAMGKIGPGASDAARGAAQLSEGMSGLDLVGGRLTGTILRLGGAIAAYLSFEKMIEAARETQDEMRRMQIVTQATAEELGRFQSTAGQVAASTRFTFTDSIEGMIALARSGMSTDQVLRAMPAVTLLAARAMVPLKDAAEATTQAMHNFGKSKDDADVVANSLLKIQQVSRVPLDTLMASMHHVGTVGGEMGAKLGDVTAALAIFAQEAVPARQASMGLESIFRSFVAPSTEAKRVLYDLGIQLKDLPIGDLGRALETLAQHNITSAEAMALVGDRAGGLLLKLIDLRGRFKEWSDAVGSTTHQLADQQKPVDGLTDAYKHLSEAVRKLAVDQDLGGMWKSAIDSTTTMVTSVNNLTNSLRELWRARDENPAPKGPLEAWGEWKAAGDRVKRYWPDPNINPATGGAWGQYGPDVPSSIRWQDEWQWQQPMKTPASIKAAAAAAAGQAAAAAGMQNTADAARVAEDAITRFIAATEREVNVVGKMTEEEKARDAVWEEAQNAEQAASRKIGYFEMIALAQLADARGEAAANKQKAAGERRGDRLFTDLADEEKLVGEVGDSYDHLRRTIMATRQAEHAGLTGADAQEYVRRKVAVEELNEEMRKLSETGKEAGQDLSDALFDMASGAKSARDALQELANQVEKLAFQQLVGNPLQKGGSGLMGMLASLFGGGGPGVNPMTGGPMMAAGEFMGPMPMLRGGIIPAQSGVILDQLSYLMRGGSVYSAAEGGASAPEVVMPLVRDSQNRLGVAGTGGGGNVTMVFPAVRSREDARAIRTTMSQAARMMVGAATRRKGMRPA